MDEEKDEKIKSTKAMIRSVLISEKHGVPASRFLDDYREITGEKIPFKLFGFSRVEDFIRSIPDVVRIGHGLGEPTYYAVADEATAHIQSLVAKQRSKKPKPLNKGHVRFPKKRTAHGHRPYNGPVGAWPYRSPSHPTFRVKIPLISPSNECEKYFASSPLFVTVRNKTNGSDETERLIQRKAAVGNTGKELISKALRTVILSGDSPDKKIQYMSRYEVPPRFQHHHSASSEGNEKPVAGFRQHGNVSVAFRSKRALWHMPGPPVQTFDASAMSAAESSSPSNAKDTKSSYSIFRVVAPSLKAGPEVSQGDLPTRAKEWTVRVLKNFPNGLWLTRFEVLYQEEYGVAAPSNLLKLLEEWPQITIEQMIGDRYLLHLAKTKPELQPQEKPKPVWQDFFISDAKLLPVNSTYVYVSFLRDPLDFYVQEENSCVDDIVTKLGEMCKEQVVPDMSVLSPGTFCAALYHEDKCWYRARVQNIVNSSEVVVFFVDYGNVELVALSDIRCLTKETAEIPAQAISCRLFGLKPIKDTGWSQQALTAFSEFVKDQKLEATVYGYEGSQCVVEMFKEDTGDLSLNQYLFEAKLADTYLVYTNAGVSDASEEEEPVELELPADDFVEVIVAYVDFNSCTVRLVGKKYSERLEEFEDNLATLYKSAAKATPLNVGSVCIASADLLYHRVKITELEGQKANCFFVDHGYTEWFYLDQLRPLDPKVNKQVAYQAIPCILAGLENFMKLPTAMTELIERSRNKICAAEVISRDPLTLMLYDTYSSEDININQQIAEKLIQEGARVNMEIFGSSSQPAASDSSRSSSPLSHKSGYEGNVETVSPASENLSLNVESSEGAGDAGINAEVPMKKLLYTWGLPQVSEADPSKSDSSTSAFSQDSVINKTSSNSSVATISVPSCSTTKSTFTTSKSSEEHQQVPMPGLMPLPECGKFFCVYVHKIYDPYNFVVISHAIYSQLEEMMASMNMQFVNMGGSGDASQQQKASVVKDPLVDNLYMARRGNVLYRAIFVGTIEGQYRLYFPDYCMYDVVSPDALFILPTPYWSLPFAACKARLHGVKPKKEAWSVGTTLKFMQLAQDHVLVAMLKVVDDPVGEEHSSTVHKTRGRVVTLSLVDTSDPDDDVIISDQLISCELSVADD